MNLGFDSDDHVYTLDGEPVPSVTQVLDENRLLPDYSLLDPYYAERGTAVHEAMALHLLDRLDWDSLDDHTRPFVERGANFVDTLGLEPRVIEFRWADPVRRYAGTLDLFCDSTLGPMLLDWKAGQWEPAHAIQAAGGYWPLLRLAVEEGAVPVESAELRRCRIGVVCLKTDMPKPRWIEDRDEQIATFRAALRMTQWRARNPRKRIR